MDTKINQILNLLQETTKNEEIEIKPIDKLDVVEIKPIDKLDVVEIKPIDKLDVVSNDKLDVVEIKEEIKEIEIKEEIKTNKIIWKTSNVREKNPIDDKGTFRGSGYIEYYENDEFILSGGQPRYYYNVDYADVEAGIKYKCLERTGENWSGGVIGVRSAPEGHTKSGNLAHTYYFRLRHDNTIDFCREEFHGKEYKTLKNKKYKLETNKWYNIKFLCYNINGKTKLEGYIDNVLELEYFDESSNIMYEASGVVFIRNTKTKALYKDFYVDEIEIITDETDEETDEVIEKQLPTIKEDVVSNDKLDVVEKKIIMAYFTEWSIYNRKYDINKIDGNKITHLLYAFMFPHPNKGDLTRAKLKFPPSPYNEKEQKEGALRTHDRVAFINNMEKLRQWKKKYPHVKILMSIGGWTLSFNLSKVFAKSLLRKNFIDSVGDLYDTYDFIDGIDIDWEYPSIKVNNNIVSSNDNKNFVRVLKELKGYYPEMLLTCAIGMGKEKLPHYKDIDKYCDYVLCMLYDYSGNWDGNNITHHSPVDNGKNSMKGGYKMLLDNNFNKNKLIFGIPAYWRGNGKSLSPNDDNEDGYTSWKYIKDKFYNHGIGSLKSPNGMWYGDTMNTLERKLEYVKQEGIKGVFFWELSDMDNMDFIQLTVDTLR
jgi:chitinase